MKIPSIIRINLIIFINITFIIIIYYNLISIIPVFFYELNSKNTVIRDWKPFARWIAFESNDKSFFFDTSDSERNVAGVYIP